MAESVSSSSGEVSADYGERVDMLRRRAGLFAVLCGVFCGFMGLVVVLVLMLWSSVSHLLVYFHVMVGLLVSSSFVFVVAALLFVSVSTTSSSDETLDDLAKDYVLSRAVMVLAVVFLFGGLVAFTFYVSVWYMLILSVIGVFVMAVRFLQLLVSLSTD